MSARLRLSGDDIARFVSGRRGKRRGMSSALNLTTDHDEIRRWVESVGARPVQARLASSTGPVGVPALDVPGRRTPGAVEPIAWDDWFAEFDRAGLALLYEPAPEPRAAAPYGKLVPR